MAPRPALTFDFDSAQYRGTSPRQFVVYLGRRFRLAHFSVTRDALLAMLPEAADADSEQLFTAAAGQIIKSVYRLHGEGLVTPGASIVIDADNWRDRDVARAADTKPGMRAVERNTLKLRYVEDTASPPTQANSGNAHQDLAGRTGSDRT